MSNRTRKHLVGFILLMGLCLCALGARASSVGDYYVGRCYEWRMEDGEPRLTPDSDENTLTKLDYGYQIGTPIELYGNKRWKISWRASLPEGQTAVLPGSTIPHLHPYVTLSSESLGIDVFTYFNLDYQNATAILSDMSLGGKEHDFVLPNQPTSSGKIRLTLTVDGERVPVSAGSLEEKGALNCLTLNMLLGSADQQGAVFLGTVEYLRVEEDAAEVVAFTGEATAYQEIECAYDDWLSFAVQGDRRVTYATDNPSVLMLNPETGGGRIVGVGTARVHAVKNGKTVRGYHVTARKADISLLLVVGQSNAEGYSGTPMTSYRVKPGTAYSTYLPSSLAKTWNITRESVQMDNALTYQGVGRRGMDGGIAAGWIRETGEKVWVVNMGHGGSGVLTWIKGGVNYDEAAMVYGYALELLKSKSDVYNLKHKGYFWLQGCANKTMDEESYTAAYQSMHESLIGDFGMEFGAIVLVRAAMTANSPADVADNGPRLSQKHMAESKTPPFDTVYMATEAGDLWLSDASVSAWFSGDNLTDNPYYNADTQKNCPNPLWSAADMNVPTTILAVHPDIHYRQVGYNELGRLAGEAMGAIISSDAP